jgi:parallel beta-helix repeat protein
VTNTAPSNAVVIAAGASIQAAVDANPAGTAFLLSAGTYSGQTISPQSGDSFYGQNGQTVLDGGGAQQAFRGQCVSNVTLSGLTIANYAPAAQGVGTLGTDASSVNWVVQNCTFTGTTVGVPIMLGTGMTVSGCSVYGNQMAGISGWNVTGGVIQNNNIYANNLSNQSPFTATGSNAGIKIAQCTNVQILNNNIHDNTTAPGVWTDISCSGTVIDGNTIANNGGPGVLLELDYGATVRNNLIQNNNQPALDGCLGGGVYLQNAANANVYSNTITGNVGGVWIYQSDRGSGTQGPWVVNNDAIHNNIIQMSAGVSGYSSSVSAAAVNFYGNTQHLSGSAQLVSSGVATSGTVAVDANATWALSGANTIANVTNNGTVAIASGGSLTVSSAVDPSSTGTFQLQGSATLEIAAVLGTNSKIQFLGAAPSAKLVIDNLANFGTHVGTTSYAGPLLEGFAAGNVIDLKGIGFSTVPALTYTASNGTVQVGHALLFQQSSLGAGAFHVASDGAGGSLLTHS